MDGAKVTQGPRAVTVASWTLYADAHPGGTGMFRRSALTVLIVMLVSACGSGDDAAIVAQDDQPTATVTTEAPRATTAAAADDIQSATTASDDHEATDQDHDESEAHEDAMTTSTHDGAVADGARVIEISMTEMEFHPSDIRVEAGQTVRFIVTNVGATTHEFRLSNPHRIEEHMADHDDAGHGDDAGHHEDADVVLELEPGVTGEVTVTFPEDTDLYSQVACLLPGHYEAGMHGEVLYDA